MHCNDENKEPSLREALKSDPDFRELLGLPGFERLLQETQNPIKTKPAPAIPNEELFFLPVRVNMQSLLDDLDRILRIMETPGMANCDGISRGLLEMLLMKYRLYCVRLMRLGKREKAMRVQEQLVRALNEKIAELGAKHDA